MKTKLGTPASAAFACEVSTAPVLVPLLPGGRPVGSSPEPVASLDRVESGRDPAAGFAASRGSASRFEVASLAERASAPVTTAVGRRATGRSQQAGIPESVGATRLADRAGFERLSRRDDVPGAIQAKVVKFLIVGVDRARPKLFLINTKTFDYHFDFATRGLGMVESLESFNAKTYFSDRRENLAGSILLHENYESVSGPESLFVVEFWPTDPVKASHVQLAYASLGLAMPWARDHLKYHPAGSTQEALFHREAETFEQLKVPVIESKDLFKNIAYAPMNMGVGYGTLRVFDPADPRSRAPSIRDVVIFKVTPNDLSHVGGIITENPETPLSHINLKAKQNGTPNAYVKNATQHPRIVPLLRDPPPVVRFQVGPDGFELEEATAAEAEAWLERTRPSDPRTPERDLSVAEIRPLEALHFGDARAFGAKATNVAELRRLFPVDTVPNGFAVPFAFYDRFMRENGFYARVDAMLADPEFMADARVRDTRLKALRKEIKASPMPAELSVALGALERSLREQVGVEAGLRCRSSTNNEDLPHFNGAGLYDSFTHRPEEGIIDKTIKQVYASLWNLRAFEEREFYRISHTAAAMGVLVHKNEDGERANGVAYTKNIYDAQWPGFYINAQVGEDLVTNPRPGATPDELLVSRIGPNGENETQYVSHSSLLPDGQRVLDEASLAALVAALEKIHARFAELYERVGDSTFAMDVEFKLRSDGRLQIKQARPVVD